MRPFHLAIPVDDLAAAERFYEGVLGCARGRSADRWIDYDFFGHQLVVHVTCGAGVAGTNPVDGDDVPIPHFGVVLAWDEFDAIASRFDRFLIDPHVRFEGRPGEQKTLFVLDPAGNALEFKAFRDPEQLFAIR
ncbi:MAG: VOC family protein [Planctomycetota bacterium]|jgi:extradiol dioxygenase family protein